MDAERKVDIGEPGDPGLDELLPDQGGGLVVEFLAVGALEVGDDEDPVLCRGLALDAGEVSARDSRIDRLALSGEWSREEKQEEGDGWAHG